MSDTGRMMIEVQGVSKQFGRLSAVDRVSLQIAEGEFFSLLGPSGCGKTTLLRMIGGFDFPTEGDIKIDGVPMGAKRPNERPTNVVFQSYALFPHLTVEENIGYGLLNIPMSAAERKATVAQALATIQLDQVGVRFPHQLSGGQRQRVALARALVRKPKVLLLDEPLGALDRRLREEMQTELRTLQQSLGITFVFVTHDQEEAMALSDRMAIMANGNLLQVGNPRTMYERPASVEVAKFLGKANIVPGRIVSSVGKSAMFEASGLGTFIVEDSRGWPAGTTAALVLRPEQLTLSVGKLPELVNSLPAKIYDRTFLGNMERLRVQCGDHNFLVDVPPKTAVLAGDALFLSWQYNSGTLIGTA
jgi:ABC-type Fe3+/spermidine/putrescine transport system ATPase subunit